MALKLTTKGAVRFSWVDDSMEALFTLQPGDSEDELMDKLRRMLAFVEERNRPEEDYAPDLRAFLDAKRAERLPERTPGLALEMAQITHAPVAPVTGNGWAAATAMVQAELPERLYGEVELIPPEEQGE